MRTLIPSNARLVPNHAKKVFEGVIYDVYQWPQKMFDGSIETFEMLKRPDSVEIIAIKDNKIVVLEQEQPSCQSFYSMPGGRHDNPSEDEQAAAKREMLEETGMSFRNWKLLHVSQPTGKVENFLYIFLATDLISQVDQDLGVGEKIKVHLISFEEVCQLAHKSNARNMPKALLDEAGSIQGLMDLPTYQGLKLN